MKRKLLAFLTMMIMFCTLIPNTAIFAQEQGNDVTEKFVVNETSIKMGNESIQVVKEVYKDGKAELGDFTNITYNPYININFKFEQKDSGQQNIQAGDYMLFELFKISDENSAGVDFVDMSAPKDLYFNDGEKYATAQMETSKGENGIITVYYRLTFTEHVEDKHSIAGELTGRGTLSVTETGKIVKLLKGADLIAEVSKKNPEFHDLLEGEVYPNSQKYINYKDDRKEPAQIVWGIDLYDYLKNQFTDYKNGTVQGNDFILEETLDSYQTFNVNKNYKEGINVDLETRIYLYNSDDVDSHNFPYDKNGVRRKASFSLGENTGKGLNFEYLDNEDEVRGTARSWTIITEEDPVETDRTRERLIINFGTPGVDGIKYSEIMSETEFKALKDEINKDISDCKEALKSAGNKPDTEPIEYNGIVRTKSQWTRLQSVLEDTLIYYNSDPQIYSFLAKIRTAVKDDEFSYWRDSVKNTYSFEAGNNETNQSVDCLNFWKTNITAKYGVKYEFVSGTDNKKLPSEVTALLPEDNNTYNHGSTVTAIEPNTTTITVSDGVWTFKGYDADKRVATSNITFTGTWEFTANTYPVSYEFVSGTDGRELPEDVLALVPNDDSKYDHGSTVNAIRPDETSVAVEDGVWTFKGYDKEKAENIISAVEFIGTWEFKMASTSDKETSHKESSHNNTSNSDRPNADEAKTGDDSNIALCVALMLIAATGVAVTIVYDRKKKVQ